MLLEGSISSDKTQKLYENYAKLLNSGISASKILVLLQNSNKKNEFLEKTFELLNIQVLEKLQVYSFFGLVYNTISDNWALIENNIPDTSNTKILPNLTGLEVSQYIMKRVIKDVTFEGYNSKKSLLHQLFRRYSLIVQNNLSDKDVDWRAEEVLRESFAPDAKLALNKFKHETLNSRAFDYLRQSLIFNYIYQNTDYFENIEYLILDDADEITPICFDFIKYLKPQLKDVFIAYDKLGSSRSGYLSADKKTPFGFEKLFNQTPEILPIKTQLEQDANILFSNITDQKAEKLKRFSLNSLSKRAQMLDLGINDIKNLLKSGIKPSEIVITTPVTDDMLKFYLKNELGNLCNIVLLSGSEKLIQNPIVAGCINILKYTNNIKLSNFDKRKILNFLNIPLKHCRKILENDKFTGTDLKFEDYNEKYKKFLTVLNELDEISLSQQVFKIYENLVDISLYTKEELIKFNFFIKQLQDFENVFLDLDKASVINQVENSIISENPYSTLEIAENDLIVATPQKIIDNQIQSKYQFWFDVSSDEWIKNDTGPLYNAWVMQSGWDKEEFTLQDNIELSNQKNARILRKLTLCAKDKIFAYASLFDSSGIENFGGIEKYLNSEKSENVVINSKPFTPREDQKPVLEYKKGQMAISAVPGAGKTTILLELIIKLLKDGINPENIFVLTYMESAARNFRERIQNANKDLSQLPNISTIHGLALKILKENDNYQKLGLNADFEICDDTQRIRIIKDISAKFEIKGKEIDDFDRATSVFKMGNCTLTPTTSTLTDVKTKKFLDFYQTYQATLKESNIIDYDDMLLMSVKLLEENPDILSYYQELCQYIIEDEAQDSSAIQQRLIGLLSSKHKNLIRCGDINQAITTTFSNADVEGFRNFIKNADKTVSMDCSQRCTKDVWQLANNLVSFAEKNEASKNSFYEIFMKPVEGRNPVSANATNAFSLENEAMERNFVLKEIKELLNKNPKSTVGILLRSNFSVGRWTNFISNSGMKTITRSECLEQKAVYRAIFAIMKIIQSPFDNENIAENYATLAELGFAKSNLYQLIKECPEPFIEKDVDKMNNYGLEKFYWDIVYWLTFSTLAPEELAIKIGTHYFCTEVEKSNVYLISTLIKRLSANSKDYSLLLEQLETLAKKTNLSGFKFFSEEEKSDKEILEGKVQIMTLHKSKGDEFDYVFLPEMTEKTLPLTIDNIPLAKNTRFMENIRELNPEYKQKTDEELKKFLLAENLRLMYVAITRAKKKLFVTTNKSSKLKSKIPPEPNTIISIIKNYQG